jgi:hypothetical protein
VRENSRVCGQTDIFSQMDKKIPTPEKRNLLLNRARAHLESLMEGNAVYVPEYELLARLFGKNTRQATRIIAEEFVARFGEVSGTVDQLIRRLAPPGRARTWGELEERMSKMCWVDNCFWIRHLKKQPDVPEQELFFLRVKDVIGALAKKRDYKVAEKTSGKKVVYDSPKNIADSFVTCELCWRSVPKLVHTKKIHLCHLHDIPSTSPMYKRQKYLQEYVDGIVKQLKLYVLPPFMVEGKGHHPAAYVWALCVDKNSPLPHLVNYLQSLNMPLDSVENIVRALEHPVYLDKFDEPVRQAWEFYFEDRGAYLERHYPRVLLAEAWLRADAEHKHGGKR